MVVRPQWVAAAHDAWHCGALVLVTIVTTCSVLARLATRRLEGMTRG